MIYAYIRIQIILEIKTIIVVPVRVLPVRVLLVQSSPVHDVPYADEQRRCGHAVTYLLGSSVVRRVVNYNNPILKIQMREQVFQYFIHLPSLLLSFFTFISFA